MEHSRTVKVSKMEQIVYFYSFLTIFNSLLWCPLRVEATSWQNGVPIKSHLHRGEYKIGFIVTFAFKLMLQLAAINAI